MNPHVRAERHTVASNLMVPSDLESFGEDSRLVRAATTHAGHGGGGVGCGHAIS